MTTDKTVSNAQKPKLSITCRLNPIAKQRYNQGFRCKYKI